MNKLLTYLSLCCWKLGWNAIKFWYCLVSFAQYVDIWQEIHHKTSHTPSQIFALIKRPRYCKSFIPQFFQFYEFHTEIISQSLNMLLLLFTFEKENSKNWDLFWSSASKFKSGKSNSRVRIFSPIFRLERINPIN